MSRAVWSQCLFFVLFTANLLWFRTASALGNEIDHSALLKFKESISKDPFGALSSWNSFSHFCNWHGITCSHRRPRVIELNLTGYHLDGLVAPNIGNLSFLRILNLGNNNFNGKVPQELGRLFRLQILSLTNNTLSGEFPINLVNCSELRFLDLGGNHFIGQIPIKIDSLGKLEELRLNDNNLTGRIPSSIGNLSSLTTLRMGRNNLEGDIPKEISYLKKLSLLTVSENKLSGKFPSCLYNLSSLTLISIGFNQFNGSLEPNMFLNLPNLKAIYIAGNQFLGSIPASITNASGIQIIEVSRNFLTGQVPTLGNLRDISVLNLELNNLGSNSSGDLQFLMSLRNCSELDKLSINHNNFGGQLPNFVGNFSTQLTQLYLANNQIYGKIPAELGNLNSLVLLTMADNDLTGIIPDTLGKLQQMQVLDLSGNKLSGDIPTFIGNLSQLYILDLSKNMLSGNIPPTIGNCRNLGNILLSYNNLTGAIPLQMFALPSLSIKLDVSNNLLSGSLPAEVGMLKNINELDMSENHFSGVIPETIEECLVLEYLHLQGNSFYGSMPLALASLKGLRLLDLSRNNLSGSIPKGLQNISVLEYFNASFNKLEGEVPTNGVFRNVSAISLTGNDKLCGGISEMKLPPCHLKPTEKRKHHNFKLLVVILCLAVFLPILVCILAIYLTKKRHKKASTNSTIDQLPKVSYRSLHQATNGFSASNLIGRGSHGFVYKGNLDSNHQRVVAIKVLNLQMKGAHKSFIAECNILKNIRHRNLVKIITCCSSVDYNGSDFKAIVLEYMPNQSLEEWLHPENGSVERPRTLNLKTRLEIIIGVAFALHYLHYECEEPIIHCDLKPSNILLDDDMVAHVSDFGLARLLSTVNNDFHSQTSTSGIKGTIGYVPPEYGASSEVSTKGDLYSFGILILEMLTGRQPTEEIFKDGHNLHNYVKTAFQNNILEIVDAILFSMENEDHTVTTSDENNLSKITYHLHPNVEKCLFSLFRIGLSCSADSPGERMNMMEVTRELNMIRNDFYACGMKGNYITTKRTGTSSSC